MSGRTKLRPTSATGARHPATVELRHRGGLAAVLGLGAGVLAAVWLGRALGSASPWEWAMVVALSVVAAAGLVTFSDASTPLLVADATGVRVRGRRREWIGLTWEEIDRLEVSGRGPWLSDGAVLVQGPNGAHVVRLGAGTRATTPDLIGALNALAAGRAGVVAMLPTRAARPRAASTAAAAPVGTDDAEPVNAGESSVEESQRDASATTDPEPSADPVHATRTPRMAARAEITRRSVRVPIPGQRVAGQAGGPAGARTEAQTDEESHEECHGEGRDGSTVIDDVATIESSTPTELVIGSEVAAARQRAGLSVESLSERTRIRPHVLERIEVDDFDPCGGDFYARGHLVTLARIFGLDSEDLVRRYDERYGHAPVRARQVFEAELGSGIGDNARSEGGGPRWTMIAAAVVALLVVWGLARLSTPEAEQVLSPAPAVGDAVGLSGGSPSPSPSPKRASLAPIVVRAEGAAAQVVIRDRDGRVVFAQDLAEGERAQVIGFGPFEVTASQASAVRVRMLGKDLGQVGAEDGPGSKRFG